MMKKGLLEKYQSYLPVSSQTPMLSLQEGSTPLIKFDKLSKEWGIEWYAKIEGANPTGSFKDRGMVVAVAKAIESGSKIVICASTGNTSASAAAYAARAGLQSIVIIPEGKIAAGKLAQAAMYGAKIVSIDGNFDQALQMVRHLSETEPFTLVNSVNPYRLQGQKTAAFEICDELGKAPDILALPVGNAGNISAYWMGFQEYHEEKKTGLPLMFGFQAEGAAPLVHGKPVENPETIATAIRIGKPASWSLAVEAVKNSNGKMEMVSDEDILAAYRMAARTEGVFAEPASCTPIAGILKQLQEGRIQKGSTIVTVLTGNGLKDPAAAFEHSQINPAKLSNDADAVADYIRGVILR